MYIEILDVETNGLKNCSVLSISAIKISYYKKIDNFGIIDKYNRFYYENPGEKINYEAIKKNKLTNSKIDKLREKSTYAKHFKNDIESFKRFSSDSVLFVSHNIDFDIKFLPFINQNQTFCTMRNNTHISTLNRWPSLEKTDSYYNIPIKSEILHTSEYDVYLCFKIFNKMFFNEHKTLLTKMKDLNVI